MLTITWHLLADPKPPATTPDRTTTTLASYPARPATTSAAFNASATTSPINPETAELTPAT